MSLAKLNIESHADQLRQQLRDLYANKQQVSAVERELFAAKADERLTKIDDMRGSRHAKNSR